MHQPSLSFNKNCRPAHQLLLTPQVISEFLHVITDQRKFANPISMLHAISWIETLFQNPGVRLLFPNDQSVAKAFAWMKQHNLGRKRILDTSFAATLHNAGCVRLITSNPDDFRIYGVFELLVP
jgi:predicted nucleic acid-binding protein